MSRPVKRELMGKDYLIEPTTYRVFSKITGVSLSPVFSTIWQAQDWINRRIKLLNELQVVKQKIIDMQNEIKEPTMVNYYEAVEKDMDERHAKEIFLQKLTVEELSRKIKEMNIKPTMSVADLMKLMRDSE